MILEQHRSGIKSIGLILLINRFIFHPTKIGFQVVGFGLLIHKIRRDQNVGGVSAGTLKLYILCHAARLVATCMQQRPDGMECYLPEHFGDWLYRPLIAVCVLQGLVALWMLRTYSSTYDEVADALHVWPFVAFAAFIAFLSRNKCSGGVQDDFHDFSHWLDAVALLPQFWVVAKMGFAERTTSWYVAVMVFARALSSFFWITQHTIANHGRIVGVLDWGIVVSHMIGFVMATDYMYHFVATMHKDQMEIEDSYVVWIV